MKFLLHNLDVRKVAPTQCTPLSIGKENYCYAPYWEKESSNIEFTHFFAYIGKRVQLNITFLLVEFFYETGVIGECMKNELNNVITHPEKCEQLWKFFTHKIVSLLQEHSIIMQKTDKNAAIPNKIIAFVQNKNVKLFPFPETLIPPYKLSIKHSIEPPAYL